MSVERLSGSRVCLTLTFSAEMVKRAFDKAYGDLGHQVTVPGFRRGKAPRMILERYVTKEAVSGQVVTDLVPESLSEAIKEQELQVVGEPNLDFEPPKPDEPFTVKATVLTFPEVTVGSLEGLTIVKPVLRVEEAEIDEAVKAVQLSRAASVDVEDRPARKGDFAIVRYQVTCDGEDLYADEALPEMFLEIGAEWYDPAVDDHLEGMVPGETKAIDVIYPEDYDATRLAGKPAVFTATLQSLKERRLPEFDDDFFASLGVADLDGLRARIQEERNDRLRGMVDDRFTMSLRYKLASRCDMDLADELVDMQAEELVARFEKSLDEDGLTLTEYLHDKSMAMAGYLADMRGQAQRTLRASLAMEAFAKQEGIEVADEDLEESVWHLAQSAKMTFSEMMDTLRESGELEEMKVRRVSELAEKRLLDLTEVTEREMTIVEFLSREWEREGDPEPEPQPEEGEPSVAEAGAEAEGSVPTDHDPDTEPGADTAEDTEPGGKQADEGPGPEEAVPDDAQR